MRRPLTIVFAGLAVGAFLAAGCAMTRTSSKGRAQLWTESCGRCHNIIRPTAYSDSQWEVAMRHMRLRAQLTEEEYKGILEFLKAAN